MSETKKIPFSWRDFSEKYPHVVKLIKDSEYHISKGFSDATAIPVGGCVRDIIMGKEPSDFDFCSVDIDLTLENLKSKGYSIYDIGKSKEFGIYTVKSPDGHTFEIAQLRQDGASSNHRHPDSVKFTKSIAEDAARRDLTINSMYIRHGMIVDHFGGYEDVKNGIIRFVGDSDIRISEDALRSIRAIRFACTLGFTLHSDSKMAITKNAPLLADISRERIWHETCKCMVNGRMLADFMELNRDLGVLMYTHFPIWRMVGLEQGIKFHREGDVFEHTMLALRCYENDEHVNYHGELSKYNSPNELILKGILFHDIGKSITAKPHKNHGTPTFYGHDSEGVVYMTDLFKTRYYPIKKKEFEAIRACIGCHMDFHKFYTDGYTKSGALKWKWYKKYLRIDKHYTVVSAVAKCDHLGSICTNEHRVPFEESYAGICKASDVHYNVVECMKMLHRHGKFLKGVESKNIKGVCESIQQTMLSYPKEIDEIENVYQLYAFLTIRHSKRFLEIAKK